MFLISFLPGLPENFRSHVMRLPPQEDDSEDTSEDDLEQAESAGAGSSNTHQSSVLVHIGSTEPSSSSAVVSIPMPDDQECQSEAASSVGIFGAGRETEDDDVTTMDEEEATAILQASRDRRRGGDDNPALDISEDHFPSEAQTVVVNLPHDDVPEGEEEEQAVGEEGASGGATGGAEGGYQGIEDDVTVVSGRGNRRKKRNPKRRDQNM